MVKIESNRSILLRIILLFGVLMSMAAPQSAKAQQILATDCSLNLINVFFDNQPVCAFGTTGGSFLGPPALACIVPPGAAPTDGNDVTAGGCNAIPFGTFIDEFLWLPPLTPGTYDMVLVNNQGFFATDSITVLSSGGGAPTVDVAAIKMAAGAQVGPWEDTQFFGDWIATSASAISIAWAAASGDWVSVAVGAAGVIFDFPTDYNGAVLSQGGQIISALAGQQVLHYQRLEADPPDPMFTDLIAVDIGAINAELAALAPLKPAVPLQYPFSNRSQDPLHLASVRLANSMTEESALVESLMRTLEKYQGADAASNDEFTLVQARLLKNYADLLGAQLMTTRQSALDYKTELADDGFADVSYDGAEISTLINRLMATGLTAEEEQDLRDGGFGDADIQLIFDRINAFPAPTGTYTQGSGLDAIVAAIDIMVPAVQDVASQAQDVVDHFAPLVTLQHPSADPGGPYASAEGAAISFDGSGSTDPQAQGLSYEWDFDLDGQFDDATGVAPGNTYNAPVVTQVGLKVTDPDGNSDIAYANVVITEANGPPQITSFAPADLSPTASNLSPLNFSATATDPDLDPLVYEWRLDDAVMSNNQTWTFTPGIGETGTRAVRLAVSDLNILSEDAIETRLVRLLLETLVPDVVGQDQATAEANIVSADLAVGTVSLANSDVVAAGNVISQNPLGGTQVLQGSLVDLVVSSGPADVEVPDVVGLEQAAAEAAIVGANLTVGDVTTANSDTVPAGSVISQNPNAGALVAPGSAVDLVVSIGPADVAVPDVVGLSQAAAEGAIVGAGLIVGNVTNENSDTVPAGDVISQNPTGGTLVAPASEVDLVVSLGPADVAVPDVVGLDQAAAESAILGANLSVGTITTANSNTVPAGNVISQDPTGGTLVQPGTAVDLVVSTGPDDVAVPDVVGLSQAAAEGAIVGAGLTVGNVTNENSDTVPAGDVISQNPTGGTLVAPASEVDLVVSLGPADVAVPDVVGLDQAAAESAILGANLSVGTITTANSNTVPAGNVISQDPTGGTLVQPGTAVDLVVSTGPDDVAVPDVVGLSQAAAEGAIVGAGLTVGNVTNENSDTVPAGDVISQNPTGGTLVAPASEVDLVVSLGPADVAVPDVVGLAQAAAESAILGAGLTVGNVATESSDTVPAGSVISQDPTGGTLVQPGTAVDLVVSTGPDDVAVPDVVGLAQAAAESAILGAGLTVGNVATESSDTVPAGSVISQDPTGGTLVQPGTAVDLLVSSGPAGFPPDAPSNLFGRSKGLLVNFLWTGSETATSYRVFRRLDTEIEFSDVGETLFTVFVNKLPDGTASVEYFVVAENEFGQSDPSEILTMSPAFRKF